MSCRRFRALVLAIGLVAWSFGRRHPVLQAALAAALVTLTRTPLGLRPPALWSGLRLGAAAGAVAVSVVAAGIASPRVRAAMADQEPPASAPTWLTVRIPLGTVWSEEAAYRGALTTLAVDAFGAGGGRLVQAIAFGLSHVYDARVAGQPVIPTVVATGVAGWLFGWLAERSGSLAAPMLAHLAINEAGAVAALGYRRDRTKRCEN